MEHPAVVEEFADFFRKIFSWHQFRRFKQYLTGLITGGNPSVRSIARRQVEAVDQSTLNRFLTTYEWDEEEMNRRRRARSENLPKLLNRLPSSNLSFI